MFKNWDADQSDQYELSKHNAYTTGSFINPEMVDKLVSDEGKFVSTEEEFDESTKIMHDLNRIKDEEERKKLNLTGMKKRKKKILLKE